MTPDIPPISLGMVGLGLIIGATIVLMFNFQKYWKGAVFCYAIGGLLGFLEMIN